MNFHQPASGACGHINLVGKLNRSLACLETFIQLGVYKLAFVYRIIKLFISIQMIDLKEIYLESRVQYKCNAVC